MFTTDTSDHDLAKLFALTPDQWASHSPLQKIHYEPFEQAGVSLKLKREDLLHPKLSGNKLYKLFGHLQQAKRLGATGLVSFGGPFSNHLHALAYAGEALGFTTTAIVRGHHPKKLSPTLIDCRARGMSLEFVSRVDYREKKAEVLNRCPIQRLEGSSYWIPEGGGALEGTAGCGDIVTGIRSQLGDRDNKALSVCLPVGTGTTAAGILSRLQPNESLFGYSALKFGDGLSSVESDIRRLSHNSEAHWELFDEVNFGGFAKTQDYLFDYMANFTRATGILLEPLYTAKMLYSVEQQLHQGRWKRGDQLIMIHTGGLQGRRGYAQLTSETQMTGTR